MVLTAADSSEYAEASDGILRRVSAQFEGVFSVPDSITEFGTACFSGCLHITEVCCSANSRLQRLGERAFCGCADLQRIILPVEAELSGEGIFSGCPALTDVDFCENFQKLRGTRITLSVEEQTAYFQGLIAKDNGRYLQALEWLQKAKNLGHYLADRQLESFSLEKGEAGLQYRLAGEYRLTGDNRLAEEFYKRSAEQGCSEAQYEYGKILLSRQSPEAERWLSQAAKQGCTGAQYEYGKLLAGRSDYPRAYSYLLSACANGCAEAERTINSWIYDKSIQSALAQDECEHEKYADALQRYRVFAEMGDGDAYIGLGNCYAGLGDGANAVSSYLKAARQLPRPAYYQLGVYYKGVKDGANAAKYLREAIKINHWGACCELANLYCEGELLERSCRKALELFEKAEQLGAPDEETAAVNSCDFKYRLALEYHTAGDRHQENLYREMAGKAYAALLGDAERHAGELAAVSETVCEYARVLAADGEYLAAEKYMTQAADSGSAEARRALENWRNDKSMQYAAAEELSAEGHYREAVPRLKKYADGGEAEACFRLALVYKKIPDLKQARHYMETAAEAEDNLDAVCELSIIRLEEALAQYRRIVERDKYELSGESVLAKELADIFYSLKNLQSQYEHSKANKIENDYFREGNTEIQFLLALGCQKNGDLEDARYWYALSAATGYIEAQYKYGELLIKNEPFLSEGYLTGKQYLEKAADLSHYGKDYQHEAYKLLNSVRVKEMWTVPWERYAVVIAAAAALLLFFPVSGAVKRIYGDVAQQTQQAAEFQAKKAKMQEKKLDEEEKRQELDLQEARLERRRKRRLAEERIRMAGEQAERQDRIREQELTDSHGAAADAGAQGQVKSAQTSPSGKRPPKPPRRLFKNRPVRSRDAGRPGASRPDRRAPASGNSFADNDLYGSAETSAQPGCGADEACSPDFSGAGGRPVSAEMAKQISLLEQNLESLRREEAALHEQLAEAEKALELDPQSLHLNQHKSVLQGKLRVVREKRITCEENLEALRNG